MIKSFLLLLSFLILSLSHAQVRPGIFKKYGSIETTKFRPMNSPLKFEYDVVYYIPSKLKGKENLKTLIFLHGGGASTNTRKGSLNTIALYASDLKRLADELEFVLVMPSGSALNWGLHAISYLKDLNIALKTDLNLDPNGLALSGHSMGGMGITRMYQWLTDEYSFFLPIAAGLEEKNATEKNLMSLFNTRYHHLQGKNDHFDVFVTRSLEQEKLVKALENKTNSKSGFTLEIYNGDHNYNFNNLKGNLVKLFSENTRNLYQKNLYGNISNVNESVTDAWSNKIEYYKGPRERYFWIKGLEFTKKSTVVNLKAEITANNIILNTTEGLKKVRIYLSEHLVDLERPIEIIINGEIKFSDLVQNKKDLETEVKDPGFKFNSFVDIKL